MTNSPVIPWNTWYTFMGIDCEVIKRAYPNKQLSLQLVVADTDVNRSQGLSPGEPVATATSCLEVYHFGEGQTAIKNYSENEGILDVLLTAKIVEETGELVQGDFCSFPIVKVLI